VFVNEEKEKRKIRSKKPKKKYTKRRENKSKVWYTMMITHRARVSSSSSSL